jgi:glucan phosphoethanolaminetransferase (alkaline phosphatase superfamily)
VDAAPSHRIHQALRRIAQVRAASPALQRGLQLNLELAGNRAAFYRVYQHADRAQVALVLLNIALIALAVGMVIALAPLVTIWGAIGIVVGALLACVVALLLGAVGDGKMLAAMFGSGKDA